MSVSFRAAEGTCKTIEEAKERLDNCIAYYRENKFILCKTELEDALLTILDAQDELTTLFAARGGSSI
jgi:hypothetical protein